MANWFLLTIFFSATFLATVSSIEFDVVDPSVKPEDLEGASNRDLFGHFVRLYNKSYSDEREHEKRYKIFRRNLVKIDQFNRREQGTAKYGVTKFADLAPAEFEKFLGVREDLADVNAVNDHRIEVELDNEDLPKSIDYRDQGAVTEVKNQGSCGSCWAFSATGNIEAQNKLKRGQLISLSEQELVDCDKKDEGCNGGLMVNAYEAIKELGGLETESDYPYKGSSKGCSFNKTLAKVTIDSYVVLPQDEAKMAQWLVKNGPIAVGLNAAAMQFYQGGVSHPWKFLCSPKSMNHGVLIVGYGEGAPGLSGSNKDLPYWIIKNSWGESFGNKGYYYLYRGDNSCGINQYAVSAVINK